MNRGEANGSWPHAMRPKWLVSGEGKSSRRRGGPKRPIPLTINQRNHDSDNTTAKCPHDHLRHFEDHSSHSRG